MPAEDLTDTQNTSYLPLFSTAVIKNTFKCQFHDKIRKIPSLIHHFSLFLFVGPTRFNYKELHSSNRSRNVVRLNRSRKLRWTEHVTKMEEMYINFN